MVNRFVGIGRSEGIDATVESGETLSAVVDLSRAYNFIVIHIADCQYIDASTVLSILVGNTADDTMALFFGHTAPGNTPTSELVTELPTSGTFRVFVLVMGAHRVQVQLGNASNGGDTPITLYGLETIAQ